MSKPWKVGITGGIGAGKSIVSKIFSHLGIPVYEADIRARLLTDSLVEIKDKIIESFGHEAYKKGALDRQYIASVVFDDPDRLTLLNGIVHPEVERDFNNWCKERSDEPYVIKEAALLFESGSYQYLDSLITVTAPLNLRIERVIKRDSFRTEKQVRDIISRQMPDDKKTGMSDFIIINDNTSPILPVVLKIHQELLKRSSV